MMAWANVAASVGTWTAETPTSKTWDNTVTTVCRWVTLGTADEQADGGVDFALTINNAAPWCVVDDGQWVVIRDDVVSEGP